jgi:hypothetical protein
MRSCTALEGLGEAFSQVTGQLEQVHRTRQNRDIATGVGDLKLEL